MASDDVAQRVPLPPPSPSPQPPPHHISAAGTGPFVLQTLLEKVPLSADGTNPRARIQCVDFYDGNLYVGTSESELLHFVQIPPDPNDPTSRSSFILASRLQPPYAALPEQAPQPGVQQVVLLPTVGKAAILCNFTVTFYSLPELSPTNKSVQVKNVCWIGGLDLDQREDIGGGDTMMLALSKRLRVIRLRDDDARVMRTIDFGGNINAARRGTISCVADSRNYALIDIDRQLKIPLMSISSLDDSQPAEEIGQAQPIGGGGNDRLSRSHGSHPSSSSKTPFQSHSRSSSLTGFLGNPARRLDPRVSDNDVSSLFSPSPPPPPPSATSRLAPPDGQAERSRSPTPVPDKPRPPPLLRPHIASPTPEEFLLVTGTRPEEPGIGMFINLDGDATRPPLEFETYPLAVAVEHRTTAGAFDEEDDGYIFASLVTGAAQTKDHGLEIQRWGSSSGAAPKFWLQAQIDGRLPSGPYGVRTVVGSDTTQFPEVIDKLCRIKFSPFQGTATPPSLRRADSRTALSLEQVKQEKELFEGDTDSPDEDGLPPDDGWDVRRSGEEREFARRLAVATTKVAVWADDHIWWAVRNPVLVQLESALDQAAPAGPRAILEFLASSVQGRDAKSELEFMTYNYIRQCAGMLLLTSLLRSARSAVSPADVLAFESALVDSELDPRVVLALVPGLRNEIQVSRRGIWIFGGVKTIVEQYLAESGIDDTAQVSTLSPTLLMFLRRFLSSWRGRKAFGSVDDRDHVFETVDAALLVVLLQLDQLSPPGPASNGSVRQELYHVVDGGVDCFNRAVSLLESSHRLYVLSRLYQSRKMAANVLATWKRIIQGERDDGGEFVDGERRVREYLAKLSNSALVQEYGLWLANRNPRLGVQVFADENSRAPPFDHPAVVALLRDYAPDAVKYYLEHLVFSKGHHEYTNDLIAYYLDLVVSDIHSSPTTRDAYMLVSETYRALDPPKPTFHHFLAANAPPDNEPLQARLRLLQLLGSAHSYDAAAILARIAPLEDDLLVPEIIILAGREGRHEDALRLLVHRLGDYTTAVSYCIRGGSTIYGAVVPRLRGPAASAKPLPTFDTPQRTRLFRTLLGEFLAIADENERQAQTSMLLDRFGVFFDIDDILTLVPDHWRVDTVGSFLVGALRRLVSDRRETEMLTALRQADNVRVTADWLARTEQAGPMIELPDSGVGLD